MTPTLTFTVPGVPQTKGSAKSFGFLVKSKATGAPVLNRRGQPMVRTVTTNDNPKAKGWQQLIAEHATQALAASSLQPFADGPVILDAWFYFPRPKKFLTKKYAAVDVPHTTRPDADKCLRCAKDALSKTVWRDDAQVVDAFAHKRYCRVGELPRAVLTIRAVIWSALPMPMIHPDAPSLFGEEAPYAEATR